MKFGQCVIQSATIDGVRANPVSVEVSVSSGLPGFAVVGIPDVAVNESRERVRSAIKNSGFHMPGDKIVVNLAPSSMKKTGSGFDLPIAIGILVATGQIDPVIAQLALFVGELSLDGNVRAIDGLLAYALCAKEMGLPLVGPVSDAYVSVPGCTQWSLECLSLLMAPEPFLPVQFKIRQCAAEVPDFADISGQEVAKRALVIAAAGSHGALFMGPPGSGKTMLASRFPSILPPLSEEQRLETALVYSVAGENMEKVMQGIRPFRAPHHSASLFGLIGGGKPARPGEISLAHNGVLFLDELAEFSPTTLQALRQPLESGNISITRVEGKTTFPARFLLLAASNPCPCGYYGDDVHSCLCSYSQVRAYQNRIGGPLLDRIDMHIEVKRLNATDMFSMGKNLSSAEMFNQVMSAQEFRKARINKQGKCLTNNMRDFVTWSGFTEQAMAILEESAQRHAMSGRGIGKVVRIARTIADLDGSEAVVDAHVAEALLYRLRQDEVNG